MDYIELLRSFGETWARRKCAYHNRHPSCRRTAKMNVCSRKSTSFLLHSHLINGHNT